MKQIALISDIHSNLTALLEVLADIKRRGIEDIYCLGDLVDFAPWGNEVIQLMRDLEIPCLMGNHDERIAFDLPIINLEHHHSQESLFRYKAITISRNEITEDHKKWLRTLPASLSITLSDEDCSCKILLVHATPFRNDEYLFENDSKYSLTQYLSVHNYDVMVMGHTHQPYIQRSSGKLLINSGSVGRSREADRKASYCHLKLDKKQIEAEIVKLDYDIRFVAQQIYASEIPDFYGDFLLKK